jgi:NitT/TauT family transport system substrate-binding protein
MRRFLRLPAVLALTITILACTERPAAPPKGTAPPPARPVKITIAQAGDFFLYAPLYVALDAGLFKKHGLDVTITTTGGDDKTWAAVLSGSAQFGVADPTFVAVAAERGQPGKVVASIVNGVPFWGITFSSKVKNISQPSELKALSVATFPEPSTAYVLQAKMFRSGNIKPNIRQGAFGTIIPMLKAGAADVGLELEPNVSQATNDGARVVYSLASRYGDFAITGLTASPRYATQNADVVARTTCALQEALDLIRTRPQEALPLLARRFPEVSQPVAQSALERVVADGILPRTLVTSAKAWDSAVALRREAGDLHAAAPLSTYVDNSFAERAIQCASKH